MNGYGGQGMMQQISPEQYGQALQAFEVLNRRQQHQDQMNASGNPYAMLGAALSGLAANKFGKHKGESLGGVSQQIEQYHAQKEAEMAQRQEAKAAEQARIKREQELADMRLKAQLDLDNKIKGKQFDVDNRLPQQPQQASFNERLFEQLAPEQKQAYMNKFAGVQQGGGEIFTPQEQAFMAKNPDKAAALRQKKENDMLGIKPEKGLSDGANQKVSFLKNSLKKLEQYKKNAFKDGDYQEIGSFFGNTNNLLKEAVRNKLRSESGAAISDQELASELDLFSPSMARSDETNMARINELETTLKRLIEEQGGTLGGQQQPQPQQTSQGVPQVDAVNAALQELGVQL